MHIVLPILALTITVAISAEMFPDEKSCAAVFTGQVIAEELVESHTNRVGPVRYGLFSVTELHKRLSCSYGRFSDESMNHRHLFSEFAESSSM